MADYRRRLLVFPALASPIPCSARVCILDGGFRNPVNLSATHKLRALALVDVAACKPVAVLTYAHAQTPRA
jgi:hypothetical protein